MITREIFHSGPLPAAVAYGLGAALLAALLVLVVAELRAVRSRSPLRFALVGTRAGLALVLLLLLAQPNVLITRQTEEGGRVLAVVDDSASMFVKDDADSGAGGLPLAAALGLPEVADYDPVWARVAAEIEAQRRQLEPAFAAVAEAGATVRTGLPWSDRAVRALAAARGGFGSLAGSLQGLRARAGLPPAAAGAVDRARQLVEGGEAGVPDLRAIAADGLTAPQWVALAGRLASLDGELARLQGLLGEAQQAADVRFLAEGGRGAAVARQLGELTRYAVAGRLLDRQAGLAATDRLNLARGAAAVTAATVTPQTDLVQPLHDLLAARPLDLLDAVCLFSDGGQNRNCDLETLDVYRKRGVRLLAFAIGSPSAGAPLAVADVACPPVVVAAQPASIVVRLSTRLPKDTPVEIEYRADGAPAADAVAEPRADAAGKVMPHRVTLAVGEGGAIEHRVSLAFRGEGPQTLVVQAVCHQPELKATARVPVHVWAQKPGVLLIADRPDPLTAAILAQARHGVRVFPVFTYDDPADAKRGKAKVNIPADAEAWRGCELVVLKGRPFPGFNEADVKALVERLRVAGLPVLIVAGDDPGYLTALAPALQWPVDFLELPRGTRIRPAAEAVHLPALQLERELSANENLWERFRPPGRWRRVPAQAFPLIRHPETNDVVASLGFEGGGKLIVLGLGDLARMNEWAPAAFDVFAGRLLADALTPVVRTAPEAAKAPLLAAYPPVGMPGAVSVVIARRGDDGAAAPELTVAGPGGKAGNGGPMAGGSGWFRRAEAFADEGDYALAAGGAQLNYRVERPEWAETRNVSLNRDFLRQLAAAAGGVDAPVSAVAATLRDVPHKTRPHFESRLVRTLDYPVTLLLLFVILATADFVIRKQIGMVL